MNEQVPEFFRPKYTSEIVKNFLENFENLRNLDG